jgi:hypothetical protein
VSQCTRNVTRHLPVSWQFPLDATIQYVATFRHLKKLLLGSFLPLFASLIVLLFYSSLNEFMMQALDDIGTTISAPWQLSAIPLQTQAADIYTTPISSFPLNVQSCHVTITCRLAAAAYMPKTAI